MLGRPVHFVDDNPQRDLLAQETLGRAAMEAGFTHIACQLEPIAAALDYEQRIDKVKLTPFHGHLIVLTEGVRDAQSQTALSGAIS
jgi:molecular chaperone DnaK (HSP70)